MKGTATVSKSPCKRNRNGAAKKKPASGRKEKNEFQESATVYLSEIGLSGVLKELNVSLLVEHVLF